jgi:hypothetical protein
MKLRQLLITKYLSYQEQGLAVFTVTLSTFIQEQRNLPEEMFRHMWDDHFIYKVRKRLPIKARLDHDYVIELSPPMLSRGGGYSCFYGYHGFIALDARYNARLWNSSGLNKHLNGALKSLRKRGLYRPFCINSFLIEPAKNIESWSTYITKTTDYLMSAA